jgi:hypothetical protein
VLVYGCSIITLYLELQVADLQIQNNEKSWRAWFDKDAPEEETIPDNYSSLLDTFRKLLLIRWIIFEKLKTREID